MSAVAVIGGIGAMEPRYRKVCQDRGLTLNHYEQSMPPMTLRPVLVLVVASVVSHPQREQAERLAAAAKCPIVYLRTTSQSAVRQALDEHLGGARCSA